MTGQVGHIYIIGLRGGKVKGGFTTNMDKRMAAHRRSFGEIRLLAVKATQRGEEAALLCLMDRRCSRFPSHGLRANATRPELYWAAPPVVAEIARAGRSSVAAFLSENPKISRHFWTAPVECSAVE